MRRGIVAGVTKGAENDGSPRPEGRGPLAGLGQAALCFLTL